MKKLISLFALLCVFLSILHGYDKQSTQQSENIIITVGTKNTDLVFRVNGKDGKLYQSYLGAKLGNTSELKTTSGEGHPAYATFGTDNLFEPAIRMTHIDGNPSLELKYVSHNREKTANVENTVILLKDPEYPVEVTLHFKAYSEEDVIEQWVEIVQNEAKPVTIYNYASSMLHFDAPRYWLTQFHGDWAEEMKIRGK